MRKHKKILLYVIVGILLLTFGFSIVQICNIYMEYAEESRQHQELITNYKPHEPTPTASAEIEPVGTQPAGTSQPVEEESPVVNQSVIDLLERYPDAVGWLTIDGTKIDYPFVQAKDNQTYLHHGIDLKYLVAGTVFMDYRNSSDFTDFSTILYGHQMKNDSMFGTMDWFRDDEFFLNNGTGRIYLPYKTLELEIVAVLVVSSDDEITYGLKDDTDYEKQNFITYVNENAEQLRKGVELTQQDSFVLLSTCVYDFNGARMVLVTRVINS